MKVSEKSNGTLHSTEERQEEATVQLAVSKPISQTTSEKPKEESKQKAEENGSLLRTEVNLAEEVKEELKPVPNLETTLRVVQDLHRRSIQRENLLTRIGQLEAFEIALLEEGDIINIDAENRTLNVELPDEVLAERLANWTPPTPNYTSGVLAKFAKLVSQADHGAVTNVLI